MISNLIDAFVDRKGATILCLAVILICGYISYTNIPIEDTPDVKIPIIYAFVQYEGISPEDSERLLVRPIENALRGIEGVKKITSYAYEGSASVLLEFKAGFNSIKALQDVRVKIDEVQDLLPIDAKRPVVKEVNLSLFPVVSVILTGDIPERTLISHARGLKDKIESVNGVLEVSIVGKKEDALEIIIKPEILEAFGLSIQSIKDVISNNNKLVTAGFIRTNSGEFSIKVPSVIDSLEEVLNFPVKFDGEETVRVKDVAEVRRSFKEPVNIARVNGKSAVVLDVSKRTGENIINTIAAVKKVIEKEKMYWPEKLVVIYASDKSNDIIEMVSDLENNIIFGVLLVVIIVIMSVGPRSSFLISLSIPFSFLAGILIIGLMGLTLNVVVLFSLILTIGMIVDDAIVVSEYADRIMMNGVPPSQAFTISAKRMLWPIFTSTLVKIIVFLPLLFWPGVMGQFMKYMPITVIAILANSLLFALFFQPTLGPLFGKPTISNQKLATTLHSSDHGDLNNLHGFTHVYKNLLEKVLNKPKAFALTIFGTLFIVYIYFAFLGTGVEFFPKIEPPSANIIVKSPGNLSLKERDDIMKAIDDRILNLKKEVNIFYTKAGKFDKDIEVSEDTIGIIFIEFENWKKRRKANYILQEIRQKIADLKGITVEFIKHEGGPPPEKPIQINIASRQDNLISPTADKIISGMNKIGGIKDIEDSRPKNSIEWQLEVDREKAAQYGVDIATIGNTVQLVTNGLKISSYRPEDVIDEVDILIRFPNEYKSITGLDRLNIVTTDNKIVPISNFVHREAKPQVKIIKKEGRERVVTIKANVMEGELPATKVTQLQEWIKGADINPEVKIVFSGEEEDKNETSSFLRNAFLLTLVMMFTIMLVQFNNYYHTIIIMSAVFLSTVGVLLGLIISRQPFGIVMCGVGIIALGGIVLNNNILFIDTYQHLRRDGMEVREAIIRAGIQRLRPILLTATTAVLGLIPMVFGLTIDFFGREISYDAPSSQWWRQLSASIAGGLTFATILTLFFTPCLLLIGKRFDRYKT